jgi:hypothetical protein
MSYSFDEIRRYLDTIFFNDVIPELILNTNNIDVELKLNNFSNFCYKYQACQVTNRCGNLCPLSNYGEMFRIKRLYHNSFGNKRSFSELTQDEQLFWKEVCDNYGLDGINLDYGVQNVIYDISTHDIVEMADALSNNSELFNELKRYMSSSVPVY